MFVPNRSYSPRYRQIDVLKVGFVSCLAFIIERVIFFAPLLLLLSVVLNWCIKPPSCYSLTTYLHRLHISVTQVLTVSKMSKN